MLMREYVRAVQYFVLFELLVITFFTPGGDRQPQDRGHLLPARGDRQLQRGRLRDGSK